MCKHFHESVRRMSEKYEQEMKRCNYVTPFLSLYGQAVGLHLSPRYAAAAAAESQS